MSQPFVSICIPAYKRTHYLGRLLNSIAEQTYKDIEVVVTDDSQDDQVMELCKTYEAKLTIRYFKNPVQLGAAANWNKCLELCHGVWKKIMHDDDWFTSNKSLEKFVKATAEKKKFIWCNYIGKNEKTLKESLKNSADNVGKKYVENPYLIFGNNVVGPPSAAMVHRSITATYDVDMTWLVDIDYFINILLQEHEGVYIHEPLVYFSYNDEQLTNIHHNNKGSEIYESMLLWEKHGYKMIRGVLNYADWWRMIRNLNIRSSEDFEACARGLQVPLFIFDLISFQKRIPVVLLKNPVVSNMLMIFCYRFFYAGKHTSK